MGLHLPPFPGAETPFKAAKPMRFAGHALAKGSPIDAGLLAEGERETKLKLLYENHRIVPMSDEEAAAAPPSSTELSDDQKARVAELEKDHSREELDELAAGEPFKIESPEKLPNKTAVATAIVRAEAAAA